MELSSNIDVIINRMGQVGPAIQQGVRRAVRPDKWEPYLQTAAERIIRGQWQAIRTDVDPSFFGDRERLTRALVASIKGVVLPADAGTRFTMGKAQAEKEEDGGVRRGPGLDQAIMTHFEQTTPAGRRKKYAVTEGEAQYNLDLVRAGLLEWVESEKIKQIGPGERDHGLTDEEIADRLQHILGLKGGTGSYSAQMQAAADKLRPHIQEFLDKHGDAGAYGTITSSEITGWLKMVLLAWRELIAADLPRTLRNTLALELRKIHGTMI